MKKAQILIASIFITSLSYTACTYNPHNEDPTSTITPGNGVSMEKSSVTTKDSSVTNSSNTIPATSTLNATGTDKNNPDITQ